MEKESAELVGATMKIETQASGFLAGGHEQGAKLGFEEDVLAFLGAESDDQGNRIFRKLGDRGAS